MPASYWNPWHGCRRFSAGCANCYVYYLDGQRGREALRPPAVFYKNNVF